VQSALRPYEAPIYGSPPELPPLPPEYLKHDADGIRFFYHPSARERVRALIQEAPDVRDELVAELGGELLASIEVRVAVGGADLARIVPERSPQGSGVIAYSELSLIALSLHSGTTSGASEALAAFRRGMAFLALDETTEARGLPRWFRIGYALHFSGEGAMRRASALWWASMQERLIPLVDLDWYLSDRAAYGSIAAAEAADFVRFALEGERSGALPQVLSEVQQGQPFSEAIVASYQNDLDGLEQTWRESVARHRAFLPVLVGGTGLWLLVALGAALRRRWPRRSGKAAEEPRAPRPTPQVRLVKVARRSSRVPIHPTEPLEPDVPKVAHNGRWHTLH
jgi:hypothetical protein